MMRPTIADAVFEAGKELLGVSESALIHALNEALNRFLSWPLRAGRGSAIDAQGHQTDTLGTLICVTSQPESATDPVSVRADALACSIDVSETLGVEHMRASYERIVAVKRLKKTPAPAVPGVPHTTVTLGIIFARDAAVPIETLAEELDRLNRQHADREWVDMVVVLRKGTISYAVQFPGEGVVGDFLPPAEGAFCNPPWYVLVVMKPTGMYTFNRMCAFIIAHLAIFSPGAKLPNWCEVLEGSPQQTITLCGYQYNLSGQLMPVPRQFYNDRYLPARPFIIEDRKRNPLSTLQFLPWQDGGVVLATGKLPLEGLLIFLGKEVLKQGGIIKRPHAQISYVLPITQAHFTQMLERIQKQSNMIVKVDPTKVIVEKFADEGSSSPFFARVFLGNLRLGDAVFPEPAKRRAFNKHYEFVIMTLLNARTASQGINEKWAEHARKVAQGEIARVRGYTIQIDKPIDRELRKEVENFLNSAVRALKQGMQDVVKVLRANISFLFQKANSFERGLAELDKADPQLARYLLETRKWSERLTESRNAIEHEGWMLPKVRYVECSGAIQAGEPQISGQPISEFVRFTMDRLNCFVEEVTVHCLQAQMPAGISVTEVPLSQRDPEVPERFRLTLTNGGMPVWSIACHQTTFEQT